MSSKTTRSPSSPSRPLGGCFEAASKLYDTYPNASFDSSQIASLLGMSSSSGTFKGWLSDLKQYGLICKSATTGEFEIAPAFKDYSVADDDEKAAIRFEFATTPKVFAQILENQGNHLPNNDALANVLIAKFQFNKTKAMKTAKALRDSLEWANAIDAKGNVFKKASSVDELEDIQEEAHPESSHTATSQASINDRSTLTSDIPLGDGRLVHVVYPCDLTSNEAKKVGRVLAALTDDYEESSNA